jgi:regulator of protease activity HflC (stomatin/prohibitin superfamily)
MIFWILLAFLLMFLYVAIVAMVQGFKRLPELPHMYAVLNFNKYLLEGGYILEDMDHEPSRPIELHAGGLAFFFLYPWARKPKIFYMGSKQYEFEIANVVTNADKIPNGITMEVKWRIDPKRLFWFLKNCGEISGDEATDANFNSIQKLLVNNITSAVRNLAADENEQPQTWQEASQASDNFIKKVIASLDSNSEPGESDIDRAKKGDLRCEIYSLGIVLEKVNITKVTVDSQISDIQKDIAAAKGQKQVEEAQREAETIELNHVIQMVKKTTEETGLSPKDAATLVQTERGKVRKTIYEGGARPFVVDNEGNDKNKKGGSK